MSESDAYRTVFERAGIGLALLGPDGGWQKANDALCVFLGYSQAELMQCGFDQLLHSDDRARAEAEGRKLLLGKTERVSIELRCLRRDGTAIWVHLTVAADRDAAGRAAHLIATVEDIDHRRRLDEAARRLAAIVESSDDAIIAKDLHGIVTAWNQGAEALFGYGAQEMLGRPISILIPDDRADEEPKILEAICRGEKVLHYETVRRRKDGRQIQVSLTVSPILDFAGRIVGASKIAHDISARKDAEEAIRAADRQKDEFLATLSHELRNPLAPIRNAMQVMWFATDRKILEEAHSMVERQLNQLVHLVDDLLDVNRVIRGTLVLRKEPVELSTIVHSAVETVGPLIGSGRHELTVVLPPHPVILDVDPLRLVQALQNLLTNASKYTPRGGRIEISAMQQDGEAVIRVTDNGIGIPPDMLNKIFGMFTRIDSGLEQAQGGLGVGLTLVRQMIELHGGSVEARSEGLGCGSQFVVRLPVSTRVESARAGDAAVAPGNPRRRILVVDDNRDSADSSAMMLELMGHETTRAYDGIEALEAAAAFRPEVILLDIGLPQMSGHEVAARIRAQPWGAGIILIAVTGWGQEKDRHQSRESGFDHHLVKPIDTVELVQLLAGFGKPVRAD
jgi:two-component system CheB/CheR fusion protein